MSDDTVKFPLSTAADLDGPQTVAELRAEVERLTWERDAERRGRETGQRLLRGLDAVRATEQRRALEYGEAKAVERLHPQVDSERAANAALTAEVERLTRTIDRLHVARDALSLIAARTSEPWAREVAARVLAADREST